MLKTLVIALRSTNKIRIESGWSVSCRLTRLADSHSEHLNKVKQKGFRLEQRISSGSQVRV